MLNFGAAEEHIATIMQAEFGTKMSSSHKCKKTCYVESRSGNIIALEFDALIVPHLKQDLTGGRAVTNGMDFQVILDKGPNVCGIYPFVNGKLCSTEDAISFNSDDSRLFRLRTLEFSHAHAKKPELRNRVKRIKRRQLEASALAPSTKDT